MYNLSQHYENIYRYLQTIIADPRVASLHPFGSTQPENLEIMRSSSEPDPLPGRDPYNRGPLFMFQDQEPLDAHYNKPIFDHLLNTNNPPYILVSTERDSVDKEQILKDYPFASIDYFFHIFAAADWYRGHQYLPGIVAPADRQLKKTYITFNRLTSSRRVYRSLLVNELYKNNLLDAGYVSYSKECPDGTSYKDSLRTPVPEYAIPKELIEEAITNINQLPELRIDFAEDDYIPNQSMMLSPLDKLMESFVFLVTETCFWQSKTHLTEKIFKPIVLRMPFILVGCAHNLEYLRSYGFKTFGEFWDESYDSIEDPILRLQAITRILKTLSDMTAEEQQAMLVKMQPVLDHNYNLFNGDLVKNEWEHLTKQLRDICDKYRFKPPYRLIRRLGQSIPLDPTGNYSKLVHASSR